MGGASPLRYLDPRTRIILFLGTLILAATSSLKGALLLPALFLLFSWPLTRLPPKKLVTSLGFLLPLLVATTGVLLFTHEGGESFHVGALTIHETGLRKAGEINSRAILSLWAMISLVHITPLDELTSGFRHLKVPGLFLSIITVTVRYIGLLRQELMRMRRAAILRGHGKGGLLKTTALGSLAGALFIRAHSRGDRIHYAMAARGFNPIQGIPAPPTRFSILDGVAFLGATLFYTWGLLFLSIGGV